MEEELWFKGAKGEYNPNAPENDLVEPYSSWNKDLLSTMPSDTQYKGLLRDPSKIWCFTEPNLGKAFHSNLKC
jgi:hypothetical protein